MTEVKEPTAKNEAINILVSMGIAALLSYLKNLKSKSGKQIAKPAILKVYNQIKATFVDDSDFE